MWCAGGESLTRFPTCPLPPCAGAAESCSPLPNNSSRVWSPTLGTPPPQPSPCPGPGRAPPSPHRQNFAPFADPIMRATPPCPNVPEPDRAERLPVPRLPRNSSARLLAGGGARPGAGRPQPAHERPGPGPGKYKGRAPACRWSTRVGGRLGPWPKCFQRFCFPAALLRGPRALFPLMRRN